MKRTAQHLGLDYKSLAITIGNFTYDAYAIKQMLDLKIPPTDVAYIINHGTQLTTQHPGRSLYVEEENNVVVVLHQATNRILDIDTLADFCNIDTKEEPSLPGSCSPHKDAEVPPTSCGDGTLNKAQAPSCGSAGNDFNLLNHTDHCYVNTESQSDIEGCSWDKQLPRFDEHQEKDNSTSITPPATQAPTYTTQASTPIIKVIRENKISYIDAGIDLQNNPPQTLKEKTKLIAKEFEIGIQKAIQDGKTFNFTSRVKLTALEAEQIALEITAEQIKKSQNVTITQNANQHRIETHLVKISGNTIETKTFRYRYPLKKQMGKQAGDVIANIECEIILKTSSTEKITSANLHIPIL